MPHPLQPQGIGLHRPPQRTGSDRSAAAAVPEGVANATISSPPSTPITLPVIQYVSGRLRATRAEATSSGVVRRPEGLPSRAACLMLSLPGIFRGAGGSVTPAPG